MKGENVLDISEDKVPLFLHLSGTVEATELLQVALDHELQVLHVRAFHLHELVERVAPLDRRLLLLVVHQEQIVAEELPRGAAVQLTAGLSLEETGRDPADLRLFILARPRPDEVVARVLGVQDLNELVLQKRQKGGAGVL